MKTQRDLEEDSGMRDEGEQDVMGSDPQTSTRLRAVESVRGGLLRYKRHED